MAYPTLLSAFSFISKASRRSCTMGGWRTLTLLWNATQGPSSPVFSTRLQRRRSFRFLATSCEGVVWIHYLLLNSCTLNSRSTTRGKKNPGRGPEDYGKRLGLWLRVCFLYSRPKENCISCEHFSCTCAVPPRSTACVCTTEFSILLSGKPAWREVCWTLTMNGNGACETPVNLNFPELSANCSSSFWCTLRPLIPPLFLNNLLII